MIKVLSKLAATQPWPTGSTSPGQPEGKGKPEEKRRGEPPSTAGLSVHFHYYHGTGHASQTACPGGHQSQGAGLTTHKIRGQSNRGTGWGSHSVLTSLQDGIPSTRQRTFSPVHQHRTAEWVKFHVLCTGVLKWCILKHRSKDTIPTEL